jgi:glycosyltransferase involved in cell wall biosynthesis
MNILQIGSYLPPDFIGGAEVSAGNYSKIFQAQGWHVIALAWKPKKRPSIWLHFEKTNSTRWNASTWRPLRPNERGPYLKKVAFYALEFGCAVDSISAEALKNDVKPDVIVVHSFRGIGYNILKILNKFEIPVIFILHDYALICMNKSGTRNGLICKSSCQQCLAVISINKKSLTTIKDLTLVGPSNYILEDVQGKLGLFHAKTQVIPNPNEYNMRPRLRKYDSSRPLKIGYIGRLEEEKGILPLIQAFSYLADKDRPQLAVAGDGNYQLEIQRLSSLHEWIDYRGYLQPDAVKQFFDGLDALVIPSLWPENFPGVAVQAAQSGLPVIAFRVGGVPEIVVDGENGLLCPVGQFDKMITLILKLTEEPKLLEKLSRGAVRVAGRFKKSVLEKKVIQLIQDVGGFP